MKVKVKVKVKVGVKVKVKVNVKAGLRRWRKFRARAAGVRAGG
jgi:hypothetical protein